MTKINERILICAGGTGGHIMPALSVAKKLQNKGYEIHWLGTKKGLETKILSRTQIQLHYISVTGLRGKNIKMLFITLTRLCTTLFKTLRILLQLKPKLVIGMGGFVSGPGGLAAWLLGIPLVIHEQNAIPGTTNKILSRLAQKTLESYPNSFPISAHAILTGNPVKEELKSLLPPNIRLTVRKQSKLHLLILGGSQGALALNECIPKVCKISNLEQIEIWHQTGQTHLSKTKVDYLDISVTAKIEPFIENMEKAYEWADLVLCRSGALTVAELATTGIGSILVPYPHAIDNHQSENAKYLAKSGAALIVQEKELTPEKLSTLLQVFLHKRERLIVMAQAAHQLAMNSALDKIISQCLIQLNVT